MKRFAWLWGGVAGAIVLPIAMWACLWIWMHFNTAPALAPLISLLLRNAIIRDGLFIGAGLGALSASLMFGRRTLGIRTLSAGAGASVAAFFCQWIWRTFHGTGALIFSTVRPKDWLLLRVIPYAIPILWGLALFFFALLVRPRGAKQTA